MGPSLRVVPPLTAALVRAVPWLPLLVVAPIVPALAALVRLTDEGLSPGTTLLLLRTSGLLLAAAAAYTLADDMAGTTRALPSPRWLRQWIRTLLGFGFGALAWCVTYLLLSGWSAGPRPPFPETALVAAVCMAVAIAGASVAVRWVPQRHGASAGASVLAILFVASLFLPEPWSPWPGLHAPQWSAVHQGWLLVAPVPLLTIAISHFDTR